ncbi:hypothetical protein NQ317_014593 [Molorchus minor]|uniref:THAP-type domain-containing protein n=1 Tax=Molorchus minor TaxID=1323400 RepID=A0ABQ9K4F8_9CUCU|nr:hypothetical protein NQ317_014593 [Molorchus minor]
MNSSYYKYCIVPQCKSTTIKTPNKLFIYVSNNDQIRKKWLKLATRDDVHSLSTNSKMQIILITYNFVNLTSKATHLLCLSLYPIQGVSNSTITISISKTIRHYISKAVANLKLILNPLKY